MSLVCARLARRHHPRQPVHLRRRSAAAPRLRAAGHARCGCRAVRRRRQLSGYPVPIALELGITCPLAAVLLTLAVTASGSPD